MTPSRTSDFELGDPKLVDFLNEKEERLRFPAFDFEIAHALGEHLRARALSQPGTNLYIQIRSFPARPNCPFVLYAAAIGRVSTGLAYQLEGKARVVEHSGGSSYWPKAFAAMMDWPLSKMGFGPEHITNGGAFPIKLENCPSPVGAILVSGQPDAEDHQFIIDALEDFLPTLFTRAT